MDPVAPSTSSQRQCQFTRNPKAQRRATPIINLIINAEVKIPLQAARKALFVRE